MLAEGGLVACGEDLRTITNRQHTSESFAVKGKPKRGAWLYDKTKGRREEMKVINHDGKLITLKLTTMEAAIITEALRKYGSEEAKEMAATMMNKQEVIKN